MSHRNKQVPFVLPILVLLAGEILVLLAGDILVLLAGEIFANEWYPRGIQISLHIRSPGFQAWGEGIPE